MSNCESIAGLNVIMLLSSNLERDARVQKEARSLAEAGANVTIIWHGRLDADSSLRAEKYSAIEAEEAPLKFPMPKLGEDAVFWPLRVAVNLTYTKWKHSRIVDRQIAQMNNFHLPNVDREAFIPAMFDTAESLCVDVVHAHDLDTLYTASVIAASHGAKLVYDSHELFLGMSSLTKEQIRLFQAVETSVFPLIDALITVSPAITNRLLEDYSYDGLEPITLYNGGVFVTEQAQPLHNPVRIIFQGYFERDRNLIGLIAAMDPLRGRATLTLQGWGTEELEDELREAILLHKLEKVVSIVDPAKPLEVVRSAQNYDIGVINSVAIDDNFQTTLPNKLFDYMAAGLAIASTDLPPIKQVIDDSRCGVTFTQGSVESTSEALLSLIDDRETLQLMKRASFYSAPNYSWPAQERKLVSLYTKLATSVRDDAHE
ncbi:MAG: glycosyltransferase [Coriobacteriia bacterium]|nr:glycosyltransferase [Coriobacteriia bacterium]